MSKIITKTIIAEHSRVLGAEPLGEGVMENTAREGWVGWSRGCNQGKAFPFYSKKTHCLLTNIFFLFIFSAQVCRNKIQDPQFQACLREGVQK